jgi:uncharacterized protein
LENALIIFARNPVLGKVKTRLASTVGNEKALAIYHSLLTYTAGITSMVHCDKYVFYADGVSKQDSWDDTVFSKKEQEGNDLGERMQLAFHSIFEKGYKKVVIIGTDCFELTETILEKAFASLDSYNAVIGPSADGGYYLLGMNKYYPFLFADKSWSTDTVFKGTITDLSAHDIPYFTLPVLHDIDTEADWNQYQINNNN